MNIAATLSADKKLLRKLALAWARLTKPQAFVRGQSIEQIEALGFFRAKVVVDMQWYFFTDESLAELQSFVSATHGKAGQTLSRDAIYSILIEEIEKAFAGRLKSGAKSDPQEALKGVFLRLGEKQKNYTFIFPTHGLELTPPVPFAVGEVTLFLFDEAAKAEIATATQRPESDFYTKVTAPFIDQDLLGKVCIKCRAFGEAKRARELAERKVQQAIALFRFVLCVWFPDHMYRNRLKISLVRDSFESDDHWLSVNEDDHQATVSFGGGRSTFQTLPITPERIAEFKQHLFFDELCVLFGNPAPNEFDGTILTAIHWIGEAQHDYSPETAFLKYWTAIECFFATEKHDVTYAVTNGPIVLCAAMGYRLPPAPKLRDQKRLLENLYDLRSRITHRGLQQCVEPAHLANICTVASLVVLSALKLRGSGVKDLTHFRRGWVYWREKLKEEFEPPSA